MIKKPLNFYHLAINPCGICTIKMDLLSTHSEALELATIRNQCRHLLTNDQSELTEIQQSNWFKQVYTQQNPQNYWIWLLKEVSQFNEYPIGYFAAKEAQEGIYITEGLLEHKRGIGLGSLMLNTFISNNLFDTKPFFADIFNHNLSSIYLHKKFGFIEITKISKTITRYILSKNTEFRSSTT